jgi:hypothetical protein
MTPWWVNNVKRMTKFLGPRMLEALSGEDFTTFRKAVDVLSDLAYAEQLRRREVKSGS